MFALAQIGSNGKVSVRFANSAYVKREYTFLQGGKPETRQYYEPVFKVAVTELDPANVEALDSKGRKVAGKNLLDRLKTETTVVMVARGNLELFYLRYLNEQTLMLVDDTAQQAPPTTKAPAQAAPKTSNSAAEDRIEPGDRLVIHCVNTLPDLPIKGVYRVEPSGKVSLGPAYHRVQLRGLTLEDAETKIRNHLADILMNPNVAVTRYDPLPKGTFEERLNVLEQAILKLTNPLKDLSVQRSCPLFKGLLNEKVGSVRAGLATRRKGQPSAAIRPRRWQAAFALPSAGPLWAAARFPAPSRARADRGGHETFAARWPRAGPSP